MFFVLGFALCLFGKEIGLKWWILLLIGWGIGLVDEGLKVFLPTREFDALDLLKDWIGVGTAAAVAAIPNGKRKKDDNHAKTADRSK